MQIQCVHVETKNTCTHVAVHIILEHGASDAEAHYTYGNMCTYVFGFNVDTLYTNQSCGEGCSLKYSVGFIIFNSIFCVTFHSLIHPCIELLVELEHKPVAIEKLLW